jgi:hypothetical protein
MFATLLLLVTLTPPWGQLGIGDSVVVEESLFARAPAYLYVAVGAQWDSTPCIGFEFVPDTNRTTVKDSVRSDKGVWVSFFKAAYATPLSWHLDTVRLFRPGSETLKVRYWNPNELPYQQVSKFRVSGLYWRASLGYIELDNVKVWSDNPYMKRIRFKKL